MKNDINLLFKRKVKKHLGKRWLGILFGVAVLAGGLYAGITLPAGALEAEKRQVAKLDEEISASADSADTLLNRLNYLTFLNEQLDGLRRLSIEKSDVSDYIDIVEKSIPTEANITNLTFASDMMQISGVANNDAVIATFCLRLRETNVFEDVFVYTSKADLVTGQTSEFMLTAKLPTSLSTSTVKLFEAETENEMQDKAAQINSQASQEDMQ